jgi:hypothetical protein
VYYSLLVHLLPVLVVALLDMLDMLDVIDRGDLEQFARVESPLWVTGLVSVTILLFLPALAAGAAWRWTHSDMRRRLYESSERLNADTGRRRRGTLRSTTTP